MHQTTHANLGRSFAFKPRRKRHARDPRANFTITESDIALLTQVVRFRLLSTPQAEALDPRHGDFVRRRLRDLYDHGYLDRPEAELARLFRMRNAPGISAITNKGARLLREMGALPPSLSRRRVDWWTKNSRLSDAAFIEHTLKVTDAVLAFARHAKRYDIELRDHHDLVADMPEETRNLVLPFRLRAVIDPMDVDRHGELRLRGVTPDRLLSFTGPHSRRINVALEIDNGTMPEARSSLDQTSNLRKIAIYDAARLDGQIRTQWGFAQLFVAFITTSPERAVRILEAQQHYLDGKGSRLFLFTDAQTFASHDPFTAIWRNGRGELQTLLTPPRSAG